jgi:formylglycine-generating enzyme
MGAAGALNDAADITAPVYSYWPNDYGLYNMAANVSEWVMDVYRPLSITDNDDFRPFRGNVYETQLKDTTDPIDQPMLVEDSVRFDGDGNVVSMPGMMRTRQVNLTYKEDKLDRRRNYKQADYINYKDGDGTSSLYYADPASVSANKLMYEYGQYSLINDKARVYKGGSWKDRAYWMVPGTRRFLDQTQSTAFIGFRCAMDRVGSPRGLGGK